MQNVDGVNCLGPHLCVILNFVYCVKVCNSGKVKALFFFIKCSKFQLKYNLVFAHCSIFLMFSIGNFNY